MSFASEKINVCCCSMRVLPIKNYDQLRLLVGDNGLLSQAGIVFPVIGVAKIYDLLVDDLL